ncbi:MAG: sulfotransferase [Candidatus Aminicenantes bacterium]|nr:MAG: sulfotransferase [Candidatus Aminicenantes bacterium]
MKHFKIISNGVKKTHIVKPIFIIGSGRSGTTILYNLLSVHPELCWFSNYTDILPRLPYLAVIHNVLDLPFVGEKMKKSILKKKPAKLAILPDEAQKIYHNYCKFEHRKKTTEHDLTGDIEYRLKKTISIHLKSTGKKRFLSKQTANTQRIRIIHKMFPDAYFIHGIRDGRAVANSLYHVKFWNNMDIWWLGEKPSAWKKAGKEPIELCGLHWKKNLEEIFINKHLFENRYIEVKYEDLARSTKKTIKKIAEFCELSYPKRFNDMIPSSLQIMNYKWTKELSNYEINVLNNKLKDFLEKLGYKTQSPQVGTWEKAN